MSEMDQVVRWIEHIVCPKATLLWLHHTNKGNHQGVHKSKGATEIISAVSGATFLSSTGEPGFEEWTFACTKNRRRPTFSFRYDSNSIFEKGCRPLIDDDDPVLQRPESEQHVLEALLNANEYHRASTGTLVERTDLDRRTIGRALNALSAEKLVRSKGQGKWELTPKGITEAKKASFAGAACKAFDMDSIFDLPDF